MPDSTVEAGRWPLCHRAPSGRSRLTGAGVVAILAIAAVAAIPSPAAGQEGDETVRIVARKLTDGRVEFGLQQRHTDTTWADRQLPTQRFFPTNASVDRWLASSPLRVQRPAGETVVRIVARKLTDGRVEFGLQQRHTDTTWADRQLPTQRFFPTTATVGRWLASSALTLGATATTSPSAQQQFAAITAGSSHSCGLRTDGTVTCWGENDNGQADAPSERFTAVSASWHSCGLRTDGTVTCWGVNDDGEADAPSGQFTAYSAGGFHSCGLRTDGTVTCWIYNRYNTTRQSAHAPSGQFTAIASGGFHSCGLRTNGTITCWDAVYPENDFGQADALTGQFTAISASGSNSCGLRTNGTITCWNVNGPTYAPGGQFTAVATGDAHSCGLRTDATITCWTADGRALQRGADFGQTDAPSGQFTAIASGVWHSCGLRTDGTITCWGADHPANRGLADFGQTVAPRGQFTAITTAGQYHSCGLHIDGAVSCWGNNDDGQADAPSGRFTAVTTGDRHSCGLRTDGTVTCWGAERSAWDGGQADAPGGRFTAIAAGGFHSCGLRTNGTITCWGDNSLDQINSPSGQFTAVGAGGSHSCGLRTNGTITCWGDSGYRQTSAPSGRFTAVAAGDRHSCGLRTNRTITCWGDNDNGQADAPSGRFTAIAAGDTHSCGLRTDGTIDCWGDNQRGQADAPSGRFTAVATGNTHSCGLRTDGTITCWAIRHSSCPADRFVARRSGARPGTSLDLLSQFPPRVRSGGRPSLGEPGAASPRHRTRGRTGHGLTFAILGLSLDGLVVGKFSSRRRGCQTLPCQAASGLLRDREGTVAVVRRNPSHPTIDRPEHRIPLVRGPSPRIVAHPAPGEPMAPNSRIWGEHASSPQQAWRQLAAWTASPSNRMIGETDDFMEILDRFVNRPRVIGGIVHDARIAAICVAHGAEALLTRDRDFSMFPSQRLAAGVTAGTAARELRGARTRCRRPRTRRTPATGPPVAWGRCGALRLRRSGSRVVHEARAGAGPRGARRGRLL